MRPHNFYAAPGFERAGLRRRDTGWIIERFADPASCFVPVWRNQSLVLEIEGGEPRAVVLAAAAAAALFAEGVAAEERLGRGDAVFLGVIEERAHFALDLSPFEAPLDLVRSPALAASGVADGAVRFTDLRQIGAVLDRSEGALLALARAMLYWHARHRFCGLCGSPTRSEEAGHMRRCAAPQCATMHFPRTDPAVIMLVTDGDRALLGRSRHFPTGMYSTLAGFLEPGESLEDAVAREVREESGIVVGPVFYHSSQPWPFPANIMLGFHAEAATTEITVDYGELADARWFERGWLKSHADDDDFRLPRRDFDRPPPRRRLAQRRDRAGPGLAERGGGAGDALGAVAPARLGALAHGGEDGRVGGLRRARAERGRRIVLDRELDRLGGGPSGDRGGHGQGHVDAGGDAAAGEEIAVDDDALGDRLGAESAQQLARHPMGPGAPSAQQPGRAQHQRAGADADDTARLRRRPAKERQHLRVFEQRVDPGPARHQHQVERRAGGERRRRQDREAVLRAHRVEAFPQQQGLGPRQPRQHLVGAGQVELSQVRKHQEPAAKPPLAHRPSPRGSRRCLALECRRGNLEPTMPLLLVSPAFPPGGEIPAEYTCDGADISPPLSWSGLPPGTRSLVLVVEDPDAPAGVFRHWAAFDIPTAARGLDQGYGPSRPASGFREARNDFGQEGYGGPCPPRGDRVHHYHFRLLAISRPTLDLNARAAAGDALRAAQAYAIVSTELVGAYHR